MNRKRNFDQISTDDPSDIQNFPPIEKTGASEIINPIDSVNVYQIIKQNLSMFPKCSHSVQEKNLSSFVRLKIFGMEQINLANLNSLLMRQLNKQIWQITIIFPD